MYVEDSNYAQSKTFWFVQNCERVYVSEEEPHHIPVTTLYIGTNRHKKSI